MDKWEYKNEIIHTEEIEFIDFLNLNGKEGWEYIESDILSLGTVVCVFKRKILENIKPNKSDIHSIASTLIKKFPHIICSSRYSDKLMNAVISLKTFNIEDSEKDDLYDYLYSLRKELEMRYRDNAPLIDVDNEWIRDDD